MKHYNLFHRKPLKEPLPIPTEKRCKVCDEIKPLASFPPAVGMRDGHRHKCYACIRVDSRAYRVANGEHMREVERQWREKRPENTRRISRRSYLKLSKEERDRKQREWRRKNPDLDAALSQRRRARKLNAPLCDLTPVQWREIVAYFGGRCAYCGKEVSKICQEHLVPLSRGGSHTASNIVPACRSCNSRKHDDPLWVMLRS